MSIEDGAKNSLWAATASKEVFNGLYYTPVGVESAGSKYAQNKELEDQLWEWTEKELSKHGF